MSPMAAAISMAVSIAFVWVCWGVRVTSVETTVAHSLRSRWQVWKPILARPLWKWGIVVPYAIVSIADLIVGQFVPTKSRDQYQLLALLPHWNWEWWLLITMGLVILLILEGVYRQITTSQQQSQSAVTLVQSRLDTALEQLDERQNIREQKEVFINLAVDAKTLAVPDVTREQAERFLVRVETEITPIIDPYQLTLFRESTSGLFDPNIQIGGNRNQEVLLRTANQLYSYATRLTADGISPQTGLHSS